MKMIIGEPKVNQIISYSRPLRGRLYEPGLKPRCPKASQVSKCIFHYMTKNCNRSINELKVDQKEPFIITLNSRAYIHSFL